MYKNFFEKLDKKLNIKLNEQQRQAVLHKDGPALVLAVPGAGKTTVLICRTANLILNHNVNPNNILSLTFSRASAIDMKNRFKTLFGDLISQNIHFSTIHSFAYKVIREYAQSKRVRYTLIEGKNSKVNKNQLLKHIYMEINNKRINDDKLEDLLNAIGYIKNMMIDINDDEFKKSYNIGIENFKKIFIEYENYKNQNNLIDFDDMLTLSYNILRNNPSILNRYKNKYKYIQIDEGQDTSKIQNSIISLLASPLNNIFVVADDDQSIYGFRGAYPEALINFNEIYPNSKTFFMEENFRSTKNIVTVSNNFIKTNTIRYNKNLYTNNPSLRPISIVKLKDEYDQLDYLVKELKGSADLSETAILYRNNITSISLVDKLSRHNIPFYLRDTKLNFFKHWVIQDMICFFKLILNNCDIASFEKIYYKMKGYISKAAINYIKQKDCDKSVFDILLEYPEFKPFQRNNIVELASDFKRLTKKNPHRIIQLIEDDLEYSKYLDDHCIKLGHSLTTAKNVLSTLKMLALETNTITEFLSRLKALYNLLDNRAYAHRNDSVFLSTLHSSKGLEFKNVYIVDLIDGDIPISSSIDLYERGNVKYIEEERRLFYVGMTRAKENLKLLTIKLKNNEFVQQSRFLDELEAIIKGPNKTSDKKIGIGSTVIHKKFGKGRIKAIQDNIATISFESSGIKHLSLNFCIQNGIMNTL
ncbi:ATP-dependent helicase [Caldisalinibacter kiritimatiensis]|uniref:DNA 3'-5' helicase n=1 Tax=Caldisalinibacter kiritimatiensis TaxID=1304284 RepID=R1CVL9_9FIRM|nr:ATP-dependent helicase [Caldisalinibacter kiritimatiensis]EOD00689.1 putative ATP-dependent DNA helicase YjcD [Caldisalinibacter kiritimatiensis]